MTGPGRPGKPLSLKARAIALLAQREHSQAELRRKLLRITQQMREREAAVAGAQPLEDEDAAARVDALLDELTAQGVLSEGRFVESRLNARAGRFGNQRIRQELAQHGLRLSPEQLDGLRQTELERCREVWRRRFGGVPPTEPAEYARQARFLAARGFGADLVRRVLRLGSEPG